MKLLSQELPAFHETNTGVVCGTDRHVLTVVVLSASQCLMYSELGALSLESP